MDKRKLNILLIEDSETDAFVIRKALEKYEKGAQCVCAGTLSDGEEILELGHTDVLLVDLGLPDTASPQDTYNRVRKWTDKMPVIVVASLEDHEIARAMVHDGVADFVRKALILKDPKHIQDAIDFSIERHEATRDLACDLKQKDTMLGCFMGGYSVSK